MLASIFTRIIRSLRKWTTAHPLKTKAIASARLMNDKVSSETLAHLLRAHLLLTVYIPDRQTRDIREVLRMHAFLTAQRTRLKNRVHAILMKNGLSCQNEIKLLQKKIKSLAYAHPYAQILDT